MAEFTTFNWRVQLIHLAMRVVTIGQIYLLDIPLLREPLRKAHIKSNLLGHGGTTPAKNFIYAHLNRAIYAFNLNMLYISGPGHGRPAIVSNVYLLPIVLVRQ